MLIASGIVCFHQTIRCEGRFTDTDKKVCRQLYRIPATYSWKIRRTLSYLDQNNNGQHVWKDFGLCGEMWFQNGRPIVYKKNSAFPRTCFNILGVPDWIGWQQHYIQVERIPAWQKKPHPELVLISIRLLIWCYSPYKQPTILKIIVLFSPKYPPGNLQTLIFCAYMLLPDKGWCFAMVGIL